MWLWGMKKRHIVGDWMLWIGIFAVIATFVLWNLWVLLAGAVLMVAGFFLQGK